MRVRGDAPRAAWAERAADRNDFDDDDEPCSARRDEAGLDYMHAQYYGWGMGRFLSVDPVRNDRLGTPQAWNRYAYALNNPLLRVDPDGRKDMIFIVNTTHGGGFTGAQLANLNTAVAGTRFEGNVRVIGPMANTNAMLGTVRGADSTDMVALIFHSGRSAIHGEGNIFTQKKMDAAAVTGVLQGGSQVAI
jgi:RHS repeat-associated protein